MKKIILFAAILFAGALVVKADTPPTGPTSSDDVTLNVKLNPIQTLVVNSGQKTVDLVYSTTDDYSKGVSLEQKDHLTVYSTGGFLVNVKSAGTTINGSRGEETIDAIGLNVLASAGSSSITEAKYIATGVNLTDGFNEIISSTVGGVNKNFNITYSGLGDNEYVNKYFKGEGATVYSTEVTYSIIAQ